MPYNNKLQRILHNDNSFINFAFIPLLKDVSKDYYTCVLDRACVEDQVYHKKNLIEKINNHNFDIIFIVTDHSYATDISNLLQEFNTKSIVLSLFHGDPSRNIVFPFWLTAYPTFYKNFNIDTSLSSNNYEKKFIFSSLVHNYKSHKGANLVKLHQSTFWKDTLITFANSDTLYGKESINIDSYVYNGQEYYDKILRPILPLTPLGTDFTDLLAYNNAGYLASYVNIVVEHQTYHTMVTEKITKCFLAEQLFVVFCGTNTITELETYGLDMFRDIIDHARYDTCTDPSIRLNNLYLLLEEIKDYNWEQIYKDTVHRRAKNKEIILNGTLKNQLDTKIKLELNRIFKK